MFKVYFKIKDEEYEIVAQDLDLSHPYFVSIKDFILDYDEGLVVNPQLENTRLRFTHIESIMIPFQCCTLIEKVPEKKTLSPNVITLSHKE